MEPRCHVSKGKTREGETGKRDYRYRARIGCVEKREVAPWCFCDPDMQDCLTLQRYLMKHLVKAPFPVCEIGPVLTLLHAGYVP